MFLPRGLVLGCYAFAVGFLLVGCGTRINNAPVEDKGTASSTAGSTSTAPTSQPGVVVPARPLPGAENAGKPGYYTVKPGDTLIRIGLETGQSWRDIARWSNLENVNVIEVGQVLRVVPPTTNTAAPASAPNENGVVTRPVTSSPLPPASAPVAPAASASKPAATASVTPMPSAVPPPSAAAPDDDLDFIWPAAGPLIAGFDEQRNKGYGIAGKSGDPVMAAADGRVVYAGAGLRGYGNLVILKHNNTFLTAYAHNQTLLVKEDQNVRKGQKIAEMGSTDSDRVKLHFEIRKQGKPVDPARFLPSR
jgi:lipoprotein NlpD